MRQRAFFPAVVIIAAGSCLACSSTAVPVAPTQPTSIAGTYKYQISPSSTCDPHDVPVLSLGYGGPVPLTQDGSRVVVNFRTDLWSLDLAGSVGDGSLSFTLRAWQTYSV